MASPGLPSEGEQVGRYRVVRELARGGMAAVFVAHDQDRTVALKVPLPHVGGEPRFRDMFLDEARIASQVQHRNVVRMLDVGEHVGVPYIVMQYVSGVSLNALLEAMAHAHGEIDLRQRCAFLCAVLGQAALGLHAAHTTRTADGQLLGIVHRDVSPQNVLVGYDGDVRLTDFGIADARGRRTTTRTGELRGKLRYLAPEQITRDRPITPQTDLWAIGVMLWEGVTRRPLFAGDSDATTLWNITSRPVPPLPQDVVELSPALATLIERCLDRDLSRRPHDALAAAEELTRVSQGLAPELDVAAVVRSLSPPVDHGDDDSFSITRRAGVQSPTATARRRFWVAAALASLTVLGSAAAWLLSSSTATEAERAAGAATAAPPRTAPVREPPKAVTAQPDAAKVEATAAPQPEQSKPASPDPQPNAAPPARVPRAKKRDSAAATSPLMSNPYE